MDGDIDVMGGKTGFISKAGHCLATLLRLPQANQQFAVVVLGANSNPGRFWETRHLFNWLSQKATSSGKTSNNSSTSTRSRRGIERVRLKPISRVRLKPDATY